MCSKYSDAAERSGNVAEERGFRVVLLMSAVARPVACAILESSGLHLASLRMILEGKGMVWCLSLPPLKTVFVNPWCFVYTPGFNESVAHVRSLQSRCHRAAVVVLRTLASRRWLGKRAVLGYVHTSSVP